MRSDTARSVNRRPSRRPDRGAPEGPFDIRLRGWADTARRTAREFREDHLLRSSAALAFFATLSLFPALLALVSLLGVIGASAVEPLIVNVGALAPGTARDITLDALRSIRASPTADTTFTVGLVVALWSASAYVGALVPVANAVWEVEEERPLWKRLVVRVAFTVVLLVLIAATALIVVLTGPIAEEVGRVLGVGDAAVAVWQVAKWPFLAVVLTLLVSLLYWASPNVRHPGWRWVLPGSVLAVALWIVASLALTFYVSRFGSYGALYGSIGGVLVFLIWLWVSNVAILLGAEFTAELERTRAIERGMRPVDRTPYLPSRDANRRPGSPVA